MVEVTFCRDNLRLKGHAAYDAISRLAEVRLREAKCVIACGECASDFIARVNGELLVAPTAEELVRAICSRL